jgi:iron complex outermembrane recepter protein
MKFGIATMPVCLSRLLAVAFAAISFNVTSAWADDDPLAEIIVTAQRRAESIQNVPVSIGTLSGQQLADFGADGFETFANRIPGLQLFNAGNGDTQMQMRGVVTSIDQDQSPQTSTTVGLYLDDISTAISSASPNLVLEDLERVEVLRGPQGTLYGSGSESGTIRLITRKPRLDTWEAQVSGEGAAVSGGAPDWHGSAVINAPLVDGVAAVRVLTYYRRDGGFFDNPVLGLNNTNLVTTYGGRVELLVKPTEDLSFLLSATFQDQRLDDNNFFNAFYGYPIRTTYALEPQTNNARIVGLTADWTLPGMTLTSVSGFQSNYQNANLETGQFPFFAGAPAGFDPATSIPSIGQVNAATQEFRVHSDDFPLGNWLAGVFFGNTVRNLTQTLDAPGIEATVPTLPSGPSEGTITDRLFDTSVAIHTKQFAVFGGATWKITPALALSGGLRWYHYQQEAVYDSQGFFNPGASRNQYGLSQSGTNPRVTVDYHLAADKMVYATVSRGFRLGGENAPLPAGACGGGSGTTAPAFDSDSLWNYELGAKTSWDDRKITLDGALFYINFNNFQVQQTLGCGSAVVQNAGTLISKGLELELTARPITPVQLSLGLTYTDSALKDTIKDVGLAGDRAPYVPRLALNAAADYSRPLTGGLSGFGGVDVQFVGSRVTAFSRGLSYYGSMPSYTTLNGRIGVETGPLRVMLFGDNLGNSHPLIFQNELTQSTIAQLQTVTLKPRTVGVRFTYKIK